MIDVQAVLLAVGLMVGFGVLVMVGGVLLAALTWVFMEKPLLLVFVVLGGSMVVLYPAALAILHGRPA